jgi:hypothetical protein
MTSAGKSATAVGDLEALPFVDAYSIEADAPPEPVWDALVERVLPRFGGGFGPLVSGRVGRLGARALGAPYPRLPGTGSGAGTEVPDTIFGFRVERAERPSLIALAGEHRFARYSLTVRIDPVAGDSASRLTAETRAAFPGVAGRMYRAAVIGSGGHRLVVSRLLYRIGRQARRY